MENSEIVNQEFSRYRTAFCLSKAILEDYANVISKIEGTLPEEVKERIWQRTNEIFESIKVPQP